MLHASIFNYDRVRVFVMPALYEDFSVFKRSVVQLVEWRSPKPLVGGSIPSWPARKIVYFIHFTNRPPYEYANRYITKGF